MNADEKKLEMMEARFYREEIDKRAAMLLRLIEQQGPDSDRMKELSDEYIQMLDLQDVPIEELYAEPWVQENIIRRMERDLLLR